MIAAAVSLLLLIVGLALRGAAAADPVVHVLVQLPLLAAAGWLIGRAAGWPTRSPVAALIVAIAAGAFWMLPRSIDAALADPWIDAMKFFSVPLLIGLPLGLSWPRLHPLLRGAVKAQTISMLAVLGFLYTHAPVRLCNAYLIGDQDRLGLSFLLVAGLLAVAWSVPVLTGRLPSLSGPEVRQVS